MFFAFAESYSQVNMFYTKSTGPTNCQESLRGNTVNREGAENSSGKEKQASIAKDLMLGRRCTQHYQDTAYL